jgi:hypothetical protein
MAADVEHRVQASGGVTRDEERHAGVVVGEKFSRFGQLALASDHERRTPQEVAQVGLVLRRGRMARHSAHRKYRSMRVMHRRAPVLVRSLLAALLRAPLLALALVVGTSEAHAEEPRARLARAPVPLDAIAAIVDDVVVFRSELDAQVRHLEQKLSHDPIQRRVEIVTLEKELLSRGIDAILIARDCKRLHLEATDAEVSAGIDSVAQANKLTRKLLDGEIAKAGYSAVDYQEEIRRQVLEQKWLVSRVAGKIDRKKVTDPAAIQAFLEKQREVFLVDLRKHAYIELR